jgi:hypothetical protein
MKQQRGLGFASLLLLLVSIVFVAIVGMKLVPAYIEYFTIKKAIAGIVQSGDLRSATVGDVRKSFQRRADVDDIKAVEARDLEITKQGDEVVIGFAYEKRVPLFYNISVLIDFAGTSKPGTTKE